MSQLEVDKIIPQSGTTLTIGDSGDTITFADGAVIGIDTDTLYIDSTNNRVGIGTSSPDGNLHIMSDSAGTVTAPTLANDLVVEGTGATGITILAPNDQNANIVFGDPDDNDTAAIQYKHSDDSFRFFLNGTSEKMQIDSSGNVGIGTSSPAEELHLAASLPTIRLEDTDNNYYSHVYSQNGDLILSSDQGNANSGSAMRFEVDTTERMRIDSSGNVLVGTTSATYNYQTKNLVGYDATSFGFSIASGTKILTLTSQSANGCFVGTRSNDELKLVTNDTERMRIDSSGNVLMGRTSTISISSTTSDGFVLENNGAMIASRNNGTTMYVRRRGTDGTIISFYNDLSEVGTISTTGSSTAYNTSSDHRLKENVVEMTDATERLKQLSPKRFNFIADANKTVDGFLAHEVSDIVPEAITGTKDEVDADGNPVYQGIDQSKLVPLLTASLKEAINKIEQLEARISALET